MLMPRTREQIKAELAAKIAKGDADNLTVASILLSVVVPALEDITAQLSHLKKREEA
jgi:hypothetical protein